VKDDVERLATDAGPARPQAEALPFVPARDVEPPQPTPEVAQEWMARIETLVKEAQAQGESPLAAPLWFEAGRIYEAELGRLREAAQHYEAANRIDPTFVPVIHAARRLFAHLGKWGMVVFLIDQELQQPDAPREALLVEKGRIHEAKLNKGADSVQFYRQALEVEAAYAPAIDNLTRHLRQAQDWTGVVDVLEAGVTASRKTTQKVGWLVDLARLAEAHLKDEARALGFYERARELAPGRRVLLDGLRRLYTRLEKNEQLTEVLAACADSTSSAAEAVQYLTRRAQLLSDAGDETGAMHALEAAVARSPADTLVLTNLARLYEKHEAWGSLVDTMEALAKSTHDVSEKVALFSEAGKLTEAHLDDAERAVRYYYACVEQDATYQPALQALGKLFARAGRFKEIADVYDAQIRATEDKDTLVSLHFKVAELLQGKLEQPDRAIENLRTLLELNPGYVPALKMLTSLFGRQSRWEDLIKMYEAEIEQQEDPDQKIYLLEKIAGLWEEELEQNDKAVESYERMLQVSPGYMPALRSLGRLYAKSGRWEDLIAINTEESQLIGDPNHIVALLFRNGEIYGNQLETSPRTPSSPTARPSRCCPTTCPPSRPSASCSAARDVGRTSSTCTARRPRSPACRSSGRSSSVRWRSCTRTSSRTRSRPPAPIARSSTSCPPTTRPSARSRASRSRPVTSRGSSTR
jgi:tetratricopeptide (TPR) repeat protein